ncbi:MAG: hypothetical protein Q7T55_12980 [Solirubrobacteraceae bacterium]|nr:hypothetical protein [Solirubrobacteraceae bacterium]
MSTPSEQPTQVQPTVPPSSDRVPGVRPRDPRSLAPGGPGEPPRPPRRTGGGGGGGGGGSDEPARGDGPGRIGLYVVIGIVVLVVLGALAIGLSGSDSTDGRIASTSPTETAEPEATEDPNAPTPSAQPEPSATAGASAAEDAAKATTPQNQTGGVAIGGGGETGDAADSADAEAEANAPLLQAGSVTKLKFKEGNIVRFRVTSATAQEVHVHGYDRKYDLAAGETKTVAFPATLTGIFEVEFEDTATQIAELTVEP